MAAIFSARACSSASDAALLLLRPEAPAIDLRFVSALPRSERVLASPPFVEEADELDGVGERVEGRADAVVDVVGCEGRRPSAPLVASFFSVVDMAVG